MASLVVRNKISRPAPDIDALSVADTSTPFGILTVLSTNQQKKVLNVFQPS